MKDKECLLKLQNGSDIRGVACEGIIGENVTLSNCEAIRIGKGVIKYLVKHRTESVYIKEGNKESGTLNFTILLTGDCRITTPDLIEGLISGLSSYHNKTVDGHLIKVSILHGGDASTPAAFMALIFNPAVHLSIMVTASHLPFNRNGIKFFNLDGGFEKEDIKEVLTLSCQESADIESKAIVYTNYDLLKEYKKHLKSALYKEIYSNNELIASTVIKGDTIEIKERKVLTGLHIVVDAGNGCGGFFATLLDELGATTKGSIYLEKDGHFPNHAPNPEDKEAMKAIKKAVVDSNADLGLIFDADVDRVSCVLKGGKEVNRDEIIALISAILAPSYPNSTIVTDSVTSNRLTQFLEKDLHLKHFCYVRGYKNVIDKQKELNRNGITCPLAMETSGHGALKENYYLDDGAYLAIKIIAALLKQKKEGKTLAALIKDFPPLIEEKIVRIKITSDNFKERGKQVLEEYKTRAIKKGYTVANSYEGVRLSFNDNDSEIIGEDGKPHKISGYILLRVSLHDPVLPLNIESERAGDIKKFLFVVNKLLEGISDIDTSGLLND